MLPTLSVEKIERQEDYAKVKLFLKNSSPQSLRNEQRKLSRLLHSVIKRLGKISWCYHHVEMLTLMTKIKQELNHINDRPSAQCLHLQNLVKEYEDWLSIKLRKTKEIQVYDCRINLKENPWIKDAMEERHENFAQNSKKYKNLDVNGYIRLITFGKLKLPDPQNVCCSPVLYKDWPVTHSGLSLSPLMFTKEVNGHQFQNCVAALKNSRTGGTILVGCWLMQGFKGSAHPTIKGATNIYISEQNQMILRTRLQGIIDRLRSKEGGRILVNYKLDFLPLRNNPYREMSQHVLTNIPRIVIYPDAEPNPCSLEVKRTLKSFQYHLYESIPVNYNISEYRRVQGEKQQKMLLAKPNSKGKNVQVHWGATCSRSEPKAKRHGERIDQDFACEKIELNLGCLNQLVQRLPNIVQSLVSRYTNCYQFIAAHDEERGGIARRIMKGLETGLDDARAEMEFIKLIYEDNDGDERVCYVLATDHPGSDVIERIRTLSTGKIFEIYKTRNLLKLPTTLGGRELSKCEKWEEFLNLYDECYSEGSERIRDTIINQKKTRNELWVGKKEEAFAARILLDHLGIRH